MSTATHDRPLKAVFTPSDTAQAAEALTIQKRRWGGFLSARDVMLGLWHGAVDRLRQITQRLGRSGALLLARRASGWLLGGLSGLHDALGSPGVRPGLLWAATTTRGAQVLRTIATTTVRLISRASTVVGQTGLTVLRLFGTPGTSLATRLQDGVQKLSSRILNKVVPALAVARVVLSGSGLAVQAVNGWAKAHMLTAVLRRFLPRPWGLLARAVANLIAVPVALRRELWRRLRGLFSGPKGPQGPAPAVVVQLDEHREDVEDDLDDVEAVNVPSLQRHPAKKSPHASKKRR